MDPVLGGSLVAVIGTVVVGVLHFLTGRGQASMSGGDAFRDDLLERIEQQDNKIAQQDAKIERQDTKIELLQATNGDLRAHIIVLTEWGKWSDQPTPRQPPPWQPTVMTP